MFHAIGQSLTWAFNMKAFRARFFINEKRIFFVSYICSSVWFWFPRWKFYALVSNSNVDIMTVPLCRWVKTTLYTKKIYPNMYPTTLKRPVGMLYIQRYVCISGNWINFQNRWCFVEGGIVHKDTVKRGNI